MDRAFQRWAAAGYCLKAFPACIYNSRQGSHTRQVGELFDHAQDTLDLKSVLRDIMADHAGRISNALKRGVRVKVIAEPSTRVPEGVEVVRKPDLLATDVIVDSKQALIASPDLSICGYTDNPFLSSHFEYFLSI